jgi:hypothetical protein
MWHWARVCAVVDAAGTRLAVSDMPFIDVPRRHHDVVLGQAGVCRCRRGGRSFGSQ